MSRYLSKCDWLVEYSIIGGTCISHDHDRCAGDVGFYNLITAAMQLGEGGLDLMRSISVLCEIKYKMYRIYYDRFAIENMIILDGQIWHYIKVTYFDDNGEIIQIYCMKSKLHFSMTFNPLECSDWLNHSMLFIHPQVSTGRKYIVCLSYTLRYPRRQAHKKTTVTTKSMQINIVILVRKLILPLLQLQLLGGGGIYRHICFLQKVRMQQLLDLDLNFQTEEGGVKKNWWGIKLFWGAKEGEINYFWGPRKGKLKVFDTPPLQSMSVELAQLQESVEKIGRGVGGALNLIFGYGVGN